MKTRFLIAALFALCSTCAFAAGEGDTSGEGNGGTDRANRQPPLVCPAGETALPATGADGRIVWICTRDREPTPQYLPSNCLGIDWSCSNNQ